MDRQLLSRGQYVGVDDSRHDQRTAGDLSCNIQQVGMRKKGFDTRRLNLVSVGVSLSEIVGPLRGYPHLVGITMTVNSVLNIVKRRVKPLRERLAYALVQRLFCVRTKHLTSFGNTKHLIGFSGCHKWRHCFVTGSHSIPLFVVTALFYRVCVVHSTCPVESVKG